MSQALSSDLAIYTLIGTSVDIYAMVGVSAIGQKSVEQLTIGQKTQCQKRSQAKRSQNERNREIRNIGKQNKTGDEGTEERDQLRARPIYENKNGQKQRKIAKDFKTN